MLEFGAATSVRVDVTTSPVFEVALAIAAYTRDEIHDKLELSLDAIRWIHKQMSSCLRAEVERSGQVHSWRNLLFLAHRCPDLTNETWDKQVESVVEWIKANESGLHTLAAPFLGDAYEVLLHEALSGDTAAQQNLLADHASNPVVHLNLQYLFSVDTLTLKSHLTNLLMGWYEEILKREAKDVRDALERDAQQTRDFARKTAPSELVHRITHGNDFQPSPGMDTLWLIPQVAYRPFTILNFLPRTVVYYYPVSDELLPGGQARQKLARVVALHKALGDVQRIRLLQCIRHAPQSLAELTTALQATKSNVHHHLTLLRSAGIVQSENGVYALNADAVRSVGTELRDLLGIHDE